MRHDGTEPPESPQWTAEVSPAPAQPGRAPVRSQYGPACEAIARLLSYPDAPLRESVAAALATLGDRSEAAEEVAAFADEVRNVAPDGLEELYTITFDLNPVATLEAGWHLWGEQYERGRFLADLRELQASLGLFAATELPDHLTILLPTLALLGDSDAAEMAGARLLPAIAKMRKPLDDQGNPYRHLLAAAEMLVRERASEPRRPLATSGRQAPSPALTNVNTEAGEDAGAPHHAVTGDDHHPSRCFVVGCCSDPDNELPQSAPADDAIHQPGGAR